LLQDLGFLLATAQNDAQPCIRLQRMKPESLKRALSIRQPFVELILTGRKTAEYRSKKTHKRERVYLYASKVVNDVEEYPYDRALLLPRGLIVGSVDIVDCEETKDGYAWMLKNPRRYKAPINAMGTPQPGFWFPRFEAC
jgi:predicted transcriptional regulator